MASTSNRAPVHSFDRRAWKEQADFMREVGAVYAEWQLTSFEDDTQRMTLTKLTLAPPIAPVVRRDAPAPAPVSPAKRLLQMHDTQFAASRFKPPFTPPEDKDTDVPRAVRAKEASRGQKVPQRGSNKSPKR